MKLSNYSTMIKEYEVRPIDEDDLKEREKLLTTHKYSVIFEGEFLEYDNALDWLKQELGVNDPQHIFYGKLGYNYGFFEFFFIDENTSIKFSKVIPTIFTKYPSGSVLKSDGYDNLIYQKELDNNEK